MTKPEPPPEAILIRLVREAAGIKIPDAARRAGISKGRWSQVEVGYETREGRLKSVRAGTSTLAHMAHAIGLPPERLEREGQRGDAAEVLREILRRAGEPGTPKPDRPRFADTALEAFARQAEQASREHPGELDDRAVSLLIEVARQGQSLVRAQNRAAELEAELAGTRRELAGTREQLARAQDELRQVRAQLSRAQPEAS